jgi:hypothetical protein
MWAHVKKEEALADKLRSWEAFASDVEARFSDPICAQKALNEIHNFTQGCRQVAEYLDQYSGQQQGPLPSEARPQPTHLITHLRQ